MHEYQFMNTFVNYPNRNEHIFNVSMYDSSGHSGSVKSLCISADGLIVSGSGDESIKIWNSETVDVIHTLQGKTIIQYAQRTISMTFCLLFHASMSFNCLLKLV